MRSITCETMPKAVQWRIWVPMGLMPFFMMPTKQRLCLVLLAAFLGGCGGSPVAAPAGPKVIHDASDDFFASPIVHLELTVKPKDEEKINGEQRPYIPCTLVEKDASGKVLAEYKKVGIKLKGAAGSFQGFGDKPALTVRPDKFASGQTFHGLTKFHLNNSVQDETYLQEQICSELFQKAGVPATRVTHARVWLNGRDVGLYVVKEGFDSRFLARHFTNPNGNLYDGGFCTDIDTDLEKDAGDGPDDFRDLIALREACGMEDPAKRWQRLEQLVDIDPFLSFVAMELMTQHWDGYSQSKNNYRLYFDPTTGKAHFLPHGMDQMFGDPGASIVEIPGAMIANAVMGNPAWRERFQARVNGLLPLFSPPDKLNARVDALFEKLRPTLVAMGEDFAQERAERVRELKERIVARAQSLEAQKTFPPPEPPPERGPLAFDENGQAELGDWRTAAEVEDAILEEVGGENDAPLLCITGGPSGHCIASWRTNVILPQGRYRFVARAQATAIEPLEGDDRGLGAGLRLSGTMRQNHLEQTADWTDLAFEFVVDEEVREVELVAELRAKSGTVRFDRGSMKIVRVP